MKAGRPASRSRSNRSAAAPVRRDGVTARPKPARASAASWSAKRGEARLRQAVDAVVAADQHGDERARQVRRAAARARRAPSASRAAVTRCTAPSVGKTLSPRAGSCSGTTMRSTSRRAKRGSWTCTQKTRPPLRALDGERRRRRAAAAGDEQIGPGRRSRSPAAPQRRQRLQPEAAASDGARASGCRGAFR